MASLNKVMLIGNLTRDAELRYIPSGSAVLDFRLAVNRALAEVYRSPEIEQIFRRAFGANLEPTAVLLVMYGLGA